MDNIKKKVERMQKTSDNLEKYATFKNNYKDLKIQDMDKFFREVTSLIIDLNNLHEYIKKARGKPSLFTCL